MNVFSNLGITELVVILLLALLVVGPERLPELGRKLGKVLRDIRRAYENLTKDLGPELMSIQETTRELRESVESVRSIPQELVQSVVNSAEMQDTIAELKEVKGSLDQAGRTVSGAGKMIQDPVNAAVESARGAVVPAQQPPDAGKEQAARVEAETEDRMAVTEPGEQPDE